MPSLLPFLLFAASVLAAPAQVERNAPVCNADNCLRAFRDPAASVSASSFCSAYIPAVTAANAATVTSSPTVTKSNTVPGVTYTYTVTRFASQKKFIRQDVAPTTSSAQTVQTAGPYTFLGCYREATQDGRALNGAGNQNVTSVEECAQFCKSQGRDGPSKYMAVEYFRECYCDDLFNESAMKQESLDSCNTVCDGNRAEDCGGDAYLDLYELSSFVTTRATAQTATDSVTLLQPPSSPTDSHTTTTPTSSSSTLTTTTTTDVHSTTTTSSTTTSQTTTSQSSTSQLSTSQTSTASQTTTSVTSTSQTISSQTGTATSITSTFMKLSVTTTASPSITTPLTIGRPTGKAKVSVAFTTQCVVGGQVNLSRISSACSCLIAPSPTSTAIVTATPKTTTVNYQPAPTTVTVTSVVIVL